jgi:hypothetical protein
MRLLPRIALFAFPAMSLLFAPAAVAVGTRTFELDTLDELSGGDLKATTVDSLGRVRAGWDFGSVLLSESNAVWSALVQPDGSVLLGTGNGGKILRVERGVASVYADTKQLAVTSMVQAMGSAVLAATMPNGRIVRVDPGGRVTTFVDLAGTDHVWALAFDAKNNALFAATGPNGKLFRIDAAGKAQVYFDSGEPHLVSLLIGPDGALYAGSSGKALLFKITGPGRATVLYDFPGEDVKALAFGAKGDVFAVSNEYSDLPEIPKRTAPGQTAAAPVSAARPKPGKGTLTRLFADGRTEKLLHRDDTHFVSLAVGDDGRPYVGTGVEGRIYSVDEDHTSALVADADERQVGAIVFAKGKRLFATSDPPALHEIRGTGGADSVWTSKVLDAGLRARFGRVSWRATGAVELSTRSGNTQVPSTTWSDWSAPFGAPAQVTSPAARFVQVRARFNRDPNAVLSQVTLAFLTDNVRPVVTSVEAAPRNVPPAAKDGQIPASGGEPAAHSTTIKLSWKVDNPDADALRYRIWFRRDTARTYREITRPDDPVTRTEYEWDTASVAEGTYRVRVEASDENANPPDRVERHALESAVIVVDNTPPALRNVAVQGRRITGEIADGVGPVSRLDIAVDGRTEWHPYLPKDGIFDQPVEAFDIDVTTFAPAGNHLVAIRAFDQAGNFVVRDVEVK